MARQETIEVKLAKSDSYKSTYNELTDDAKKLQTAFGSIKIGDTAKAVREQAAASREASKATEESAKAQKLAADAEKARYQTVKELENATKAHLQAEKEAASVATAQQKTHTEAARTIQELAKAHKEVTNAETAEIRQAQLLSRESERQATALRRLGKDIGTVSKEQAQSIQYMTQWIHANTSLTNATVTATGAIHNAAGDFQTYNAAMTEAGGVTHNFRIAVNQANGDVYQLDKGIKTTALSLTDLSVIFRAIRTVVGFTGIAQSFRQAFGEMKNMSDAMAEYRKVTGATAEEMETLRTTAYSVAKAYGESASDVISSAANMARAGYKENSMAMAELATKTKLVGDMTQDAADKFLIAVDAVYKYNGSVEQLSAVLDAANEIDNNYATTIAHIAEGTTLVASLSATAKVPIEQMIAALGTMQATTQRSGSEVARGYRAILLHAMGDTETELEEGVHATIEGIQSLDEAVKKYGDDSVKSALQAGKLINPMEKIVALQKAYKDGLLSDEALYDIGTQIAGQRYYNVFSALITNPEMYNDMLQSIAESMGSAQNEIDILMDSWTRKTEVLRTTWVELVNNSISEGFIKDLIDGATAALEFAGSLENVAIMAAGAYETIRALSAGISNLSHGRNFGGFNIGMGMLGLGITAIGYLKSAYDANQRNIQTELERTVERATASITTYNSLEELTKKYDEIASNGLIDEEEKLSELKTLQSQLNGLVGDQATAIDLVNGAYDTTITKLKELTVQQKETAKRNTEIELTSAIAKYKEKDLNGDLWFGASNGLSQTGVVLPYEVSDIVSEYISALNYFELAADWSHLLFRKGEDAESIIGTYTELKQLSEWFATHDVLGQETDHAADTVAVKYSAMYNALQGFLSEVESATTPIIELNTKLNALNEELQDTGGSDGTSGAAGTASGALDDAAASAYTLADAIKAATEAKKDFDDAMKTSRADAMNGYIAAFKTLQEEINAGRRNSTAFYASARMILGEDAYNATGGTPEGVMAALNRGGESGTLWDALQILNYEYENGIEGFGLYQLLSQTAGFENRVRTASGEMYIPDLTAEDWARISASWGGFDVPTMLAYYEALSQYGSTGTAPEGLLPGTTAQGGGETQPEAPGETGTGAEAAEALSSASQTSQQAAEASQQAAEASQAAAQAAQQTATASQELADAEKETAKEKQQGDWLDNLDQEVKDSDFLNRTTATAETQAEESAQSSASALNEANQAAETYLASLTEIEATLTRVSQMSVSPVKGDALDSLLKDIESIKEQITLNIQPGTQTGVTAVEVAGIKNAIDKIEAYTQNGDIDISFAATLKGNLQSELIGIIESAQTIEEMDAIELAIRGDSTELDGDIATAIHTQREKILLDVDTSKAEEGISDVEDAEHDATIEVGEEGAEEAGKAIDIAAKDRTSTIHVQYQFDNYTRMATGTRFHPGGISLVNDGAGPELIVDRGRAFIAGDGKPTVLNLDKGAKVFTASETRSILGGSGIPAYASGTSTWDDFGGTSGFIFGENGEPMTGPTQGDFDRSKKKDSGKSGARYKFEDLKDLLDYIIERIGRSLDEQLEILDKQIETLKLEREQKEREDELAKKQQDLADAMNNRTVRYIDENGQWHWMADQNKVQKAQEALDDYVEELAFNAQIEAIEAQKNALQEQYDEISKAWSDIQYGMETPTGDLNAILENLIQKGSGATKKGAETVQNLLINSLIQSGIYSGNYEEALSAIAKAKAGDPIMPGESEETLASLIASASALGTGPETENAMRMADVSRFITSGYAGTAEGGTQINYNYFINGVQIGSDQANQPLSALLNSLAVHTESSVA